MQDYLVSPVGYPAKGTQGNDVFKSLIRLVILWEILEHKTKPNHVRILLKKLNV